MDMPRTLQTIAEMWVTANDDMCEAERKIMNAQNEKNAALQRREDAKKHLVARVGANVTTRVFQVGTKVLIVEHERGIRLVDVEKEK